MYDLLKAQKLMFDMEKTIHQVQVMNVDASGLKPPVTNIEVHDSNEGGT